MNEIDKLKQELLTQNDYILQLQYDAEQVKELEEENKKLNAIIDSYQPRLQRYKDILQEIKEYINSQGIDNSWNMRIQRFRMGILDLITKAEEE